MVTVVELLMMPEVDTVGQELAEEDELQARLPEALLQRLCADAGVAAAMGDPRLRRVLAAIDQAPDRVAALEGFKRSEGAPFRAFVDALLVALGVAQRVPLQGGGWGVEFLGLPQQQARRQQQQQAGAAGGGGAARD